MKKWRILAGCGLLALLGCDNPYDLSVTHIDETPPQRRAVIALSDPQIYTRERLLNDRNDEATFLQGELKTVDSQDYTPRLKRDIDSMLEIVGALSVKFDPVGGAGIQQAAEIGSLQNSAEIEKLRNLLNQVKAQQTVATDTSGAASPTSTAALAPTDIGTLFTQLDSELTALQAAMATRPGVTGTPRVNGVSSATPSEVLDDKIDYRNKIVAALEQAQLDDRHDLDGNSLYRLQFKATVFPGEKKDKYAVTRVTILPPKFDSDADISKLYLDWLAYVAQQLNTTVPGQNTQTNDKALKERQEHYLMLGPATGMYRVVALPLGVDTSLSKANQSLSDGPYPDSATVDGSTAVQKTPDDRARETTEYCKGIKDPETTETITTQCKYFLLSVPPELKQTDVVPITSSERTDALVKLFGAVTTKIQETDSANLPKVVDYTARGSDGVAVGKAQACARIRFPGDPDLQKADIGLPLYIDPGSQEQISAIEDLRSAMGFTMGSSFPINDSREWIALIWARELINLASSYALAIDRSRDIYIGDDGVAGQLQTYIERLGRLRSSASTLLTTIHQKNLGEPCSSYSDVAGRAWVPYAFYSAVVSRPEDEKASAKDANSQTDQDGEKPVLWRGGSSYAYSTSPAQLDQRISSVASASEALDLMASVAALLPGSGVGLGVSGEIRHIASGRVDAIESVPLVVGFSNSGAENWEMAGHSPDASDQPASPDDNGTNQSSFGWVFGPKITVDTNGKQLALTQTLINQPVTADISVPGWWQDVSLRVDAAWAANFQEGFLSSSVNSDVAKDKPNEQVESYVMRVPLQANPQSFEQLTEYIASKTWGTQQKKPIISHVYPDAISTCTDVKVLVQGSDLWRGHDVYLNGVSASAVQIMPDMDGLEASFNLPAATPAGTSEILIWTQLGEVHESGPTIIPGKCADSGTAASTDKIAALPSGKASGNGQIIPTNQSGPQTLTVTPTDAANKVSSDQSLAYSASLAQDADHSRIFDFPKTLSVTVPTGTNTYQVTMPTASVFNAGFGTDQVVTGLPVVLVINQTTKDGKTTPILKTQTLYYYRAPMWQLLTDAGSVKISKDDSPIQITFNLPDNFQKVFGSVFNSVTIYQGTGANAPGQNTVGTIIGNQLQIKTAAKTGWDPTKITAYTIDLGVSSIGNTITLNVTK